MTTAGTTGRRRGPRRHVPDHQPAGSSGAPWPPGPPSRWSAGAPRLRAALAPPPPTCPPACSPSASRRATRSPRPSCCGPGSPRPPRRRRDAGGPVPVRWEVAEDDGLRRHRSATASPSPRPWPTRSTSTPTGCARPGTPTGSSSATRSAPSGAPVRPRPADVDQPALPVRQLPELAVGLLAAWAHAPATSPTWCCTSATTSTRAASAPAPCAATTAARSATLDAYRNRYGLYKGDLAAGRPRRLPVDRHLGRPRGREQLRRPRGPGPHRGPRLRRPPAAYQAWWEHMPVRLLRSRRARPDDLPLVRLGQAHPLPRRRHAPVPRPPARRQPRPHLPRPHRPRPHAARLRAGGVARRGPASSPATWDVLANQIVMTSMPFAGPFYNPDQWDGYAAAPPPAPAGDRRPRSTT